MIFVLSSALAKKWGMKLETLDELPPTYPPAWLWRLDMMTVATRKSNIICSNVPSMYSHAIMDLKRMPMKSTMLQVINRIGDSLYRYGMPPEYVRASLASFEFVKHTDRRVISMMNQIRYTYEWTLCTPLPHIVSLNDVDDHVNDGVVGSPKYWQPTARFKEIVAETMRRLPDNNEIMQAVLRDEMLRDRNN